MKQRKKRNRRLTHFQLHLHRSIFQLQDPKRLRGSLFGSILWATLNFPTLFRMTKISYNKGYQREPSTDPRKCLGKVQRLALTFSLPYHEKKPFLSRSGNLFQNTVSPSFCACVSLRSPSTEPVLVRRGWEWTKLQQTAGRSYRDSVTKSVSVISAVDERNLWRRQGLKWNGLLLAETANSKTKSDLANRRFAHLKVSTFTGFLSSIATQSNASWYRSRWSISLRWVRNENVIKMTIKLFLSIVISSKQDRSQVK